MPKVPSISPATGKPVSSSYIHTTSCNFVDNAGRTLLLRGVNLSGSSKAPVGRPSYIHDDFWENAEAGGESFVGRPLNIDDSTADVHLARLRGWGFNMLRFPVTWEAIEHEGPGKYDDEFIDYTIRVLRKCKEYGFRVYMDPHQDVWSRFSGGSGAPYWTIAACGINPRNFTATQAAIIHSEYPLAHAPDPAALPAMIWGTNYGRLLSQTIFTLFFGGRDFAPHCIIDGQNIQDYLQSHFIEAMGRMADRIRDAGGLVEECVIGWDSMNEPFEGLCGWEDLSVNPVKQGSTLKKGTYPTPVQSMHLGMGQVQTLDCWTFGTFGPARDGTVTVDPKGHKIWAQPSTEPGGINERWGWVRDPQWVLGTCLWAQHGVWDVDSGFLLRPDYFKFLPGGEQVEFIADYWRPHWSRFSKRIRSAQPEAIIFVQPPVFAIPPTISEEELRGRCAYSGHYYDGLTLVTRHWNWFNADALGLLRGKYSSTLQAVKIGEGAIRRSLQEQLGMLKADATILGSYPTLIGEIGTPFDMDAKRSYGWTDGGKHRGDYSRQERALDASLNAADGGNARMEMEDLSLWSADDLRAESLYPGAGGGDSRAVLLRKGVGASRRVPADTRDNGAAASSLSLATLATGTANASAVFDPMNVKGRSTSNPAGWHENPYQAVRAFSRPWPTKVIGTPADIQFEAAKTRFKMVVSVSSDDRVQDEAEVDGGERLATEIYVPLVHFARDGLWDEDHSSRRMKDSDTHSIASTSSLTSEEQGFGRRTPANGNTSRASTMDLVTLSSPKISFSSTRTTLPLGAGEKDLVDIEVSVSAGSWAVEGQTLKWWYDVPKDGEAERQYTIEIKRNGGIIKASDIEEGGWCEKLCPPESGCCVM
ncbi:glycoside hydrolase family 5 protein [Infundibulicybe gibba]|nr:glycoside hydrolase family 5 protein [Infundibulicybe gibba]